MILAGAHVHVDREPSKIIGSGDGRMRWEFTAHRGDDHASLVVDHVPAHPRATGDMFAMVLERLDRMLLEADAPRCAVCGAPTLDGPCRGSSHSG